MPENPARRGPRLAGALLAASAALLVVPARQVRAHSALIGTEVQFGELGARQGRISKNGRRS